MRVSIVLCALALPACQFYERPTFEPDAHPPDAAPAPDAGPDAEVPDAFVPRPRICSDAEPTAAVTGATPSGEIAFAHAWPGYFGGKCSGLKVYFTADNDIDTNELQSWPIGVDALELWLSEPWPDGFVGTHTGVDFQLTIDGEQIEVQGDLEITQYEEPWYDADPPGRLAGSLTIQNDEGWNLSGTFDSVFCEHLFVLCP